MAKYDIPFAKMSITDEERKNVLVTLNSGWLTRGIKCKEFEEKFAEYVGAKYAVAVNSCTSALFLCLKYWQEAKKLNLKKIAVPSFTFTASASVIKHCGMDVVFKDVTEETYCLNPKQDFTDCGGVITVHLTGNKAPTNLGRDIEIEDSAHRILRNTQGDNPVCYSFYATKNLSTGEGGMITTNDADMASWLKLAMLHGSNKDGFARYANKASWKYSIEFCGWKMNMTDMAAAIGLAQLKRLDEMNEWRQKWISLYNDNLGYKNTGLHLYPIFVKDRDEFMDYMVNVCGIHCSCHFLALHHMPAYQECSNTWLPVTDRLSETEVSLPLYPNLNEAEVNYIIDCALKSNKLIPWEER